MLENEEREGAESGPEAEAEGWGLGLHGLCLGLCLGVRVPQGGGLVATLITWFVYAKPAYHAAAGVLSRDQPHAKI